jgi:hypothetical protein
MYWDVVEVKAESCHRLFVRFADGTRGKSELDIAELIGVLVPLRDSSFFDRAFVDHGAVAWPGDIDLAPDAMYERVIKQESPRSFGGL